MKESLLWMNTKRGFNISLQLEKNLFGGSDEESESVIREGGCKLLARNIGQGTQRKEVKKVSKWENYASNGFGKTKS